MYKKIIALFMAILIVAMSFSACSMNDKTNKAFACAVEDLPQTFDPQIAKTVSEKAIAVNIFDGLFKLGENGEVVPCAVESYSVSSDGLVYTFKLKKDMKYYISSKAKGFLEDKEFTIDVSVTAQDFVFGITRGVMPETNAPDFSLLSNIKNAKSVHSGEASFEHLGVRAVDDYTLEITLEFPSESFLYALTQPVSFPCNEEFFEATGGRYGLEEKYTLSNGAFYLSTITEEKSVHIAKNSEYTGSFAAVPSSVGFYLNTDSVAVAKKINKGDYDVAFLSEKISSSELNNSVNKVNMQNIAVSLLFNMNREKMQNAYLRNGLVAGVDLAAVAESPLTSVAPEHYLLNGQAVKGNFEKVDFNTQTAKDNMIKAYGELNVDNLTLELLCDKEYENLAKGIVNSWQENIGVELNGVIKAVESSDFSKALASGEYDAVIYPLTVDSNRIEDFLSIFTTNNSNNFFNYSSDEFDRLVENLKKKPSISDAVYCQSYLMKNAVVLPVYCENTVFATAKSVEGIYQCGDMGNIYFYKGLKK